jgi:hypothetical protein
MERNTSHFQVVPPLTDEPPETIEDDAEPEVEQGVEPKRQRSTIEFPYSDLKDAIEVATTIYERAGDRCTPDQLAAWLNHQSVKSGTFRLKVAATRLFGLVEASRDRVTLTHLGKQVIDSNDDGSQALVTAFLNVPLYRRIYDQFRGRQLPPDAGLEQAMINLGVSSKQGDKARQAFQRSADRAGLFYQGRNRLVLPAGATDRLDSPPLNGNVPNDTTEHGAAVPPPSEQERPEQKGQGRRFSDGGDQGGYRRTHHILIDGLIETLPPAGDMWSEQDRQAWIALAQSIFNVVYKKPSGS